MRLLEISKEKRDYDKKEKSDLENEIEEKDLPEFFQMIDFGFMVLVIIIAIATIVIFLK